MYVGCNRCGVCSRFLPKESEREREKSDEFELMNFEK
jgi:hypothetical protein